MSFNKLNIRIFAVLLLFAILFSFILLPDVNFFSTFFYSILEPPQKTANNPQLDQKYLGENLKLDSSSGKSIPSQKIDELNRLVALGVNAFPLIKQRFAFATNLEEKTLLSDALVQIGTDEAMQEFANIILNEKDLSHRVAMMVAFDAISKPATLELAISFLSITSDPIVLDAVNRTVARMGNANTVQFLTELYSESESVVWQRQNVLASLKSIRNPQAITPLGELVFQSPIAEISQAGALSLSKIGSADALTTLVDAFSQLPESRIAEREFVINQISAIRNPESALLLESLAASSGDLLIQHASNEAFKQLPSPSIKPTQQSSETTRPSLSVSKIIP